MKKTIFLSLISIASFAQWSGTNPVTFIPSGGGGVGNESTVTNGVLISSNNSGTALNIGVYTAGPQYSWIQSRSRATNGGMMNLAINPWGGNIGIGATTPATKLEVNGSISMVRGNRLQFLETVGGANRAFIEGDASNQLLFHVGSSAGLDAVLINSSGNVGIGTVSPITKFVVMDAGSGGAPTASTPNLGILVSGNNTGLALNMGVDAVNGYYSWIQSRNRTDDTNYSLSLNPNGGYVGIGTIAPAAKLHLYTPSWLSSLLTLEDTHYSGQAYHFQIESDGLKIKQNSTINYQFKTGGDFIVNNGSVGIGTTAPDAKLTVKGTIHAQQVNVDLNGSVAPDYVFEPNYKLLSLEEIKSYIDQHKHLPEVPSAKEMETNGVNVSEMNMLLLKKIEELTLYVIELNKKDALREVEMNELKKRLNK